jgi:hypothetical protein
LRLYPVGKIEKSVVEITENIEGVSKIAWEIKEMVFYIEANKKV